jgi:hypothetical protein
MPGPMTPDEISEAKAKLIPDYIFDAFNRLITQKWNGTRARFTQDEVLEMIAEDERCMFIRQEIFDNHLLDVEPAYRAVGWLVEFEYQKPKYYETFTAYFTFMKKG